MYSAWTAKAGYLDDTTNSSLNLNGVLFNNPVDLAFSPDGNILYVADMSKLRRTDAC